MSYLGDRALGDDLVFYAQAIDTAGSAVDATVGPTYDIYEQETGAAILSGGMTLLGAVGSGFYSETVALTAANGFEVGKEYVVRKTATVDGETPAAFDYFKIGAEAAWQEPKELHQGSDIMGNIAEDTDNLDFTATPR